jgi:hypothetical protein
MNKSLCCCKKLEMILLFRLQEDNESMQRLNELDKHFLPSKEEKRYYWY